jgi:serine phosphatase RsbU (regulator of sigma subunit)
MSLFDRKPELFRLLIGLLAGALLVLTVLVVYRYGSLPTDENWFTNTSSSIYVTKDMPAAGPDSLLTGDLILGIGNARVRTPDDLQKILLPLPPDSVLRVKVARHRLSPAVTITAPRRIFSPAMMRQLPATVYVIEVIEGGASDRAGMQAGDLILKINNQAFTNSMEADRILGRGQTGKDIDYLILRGNREINLHVTLASFGFPFALLTMVVCGLAFMGLGMFLTLSRPQVAAARFVGAAFLVLGFAIGISTTTRGLGSDYLVIVRHSVWVSSVFFGIALLFHGGLYFPKERPEMLERGWIRGTAYALAAVCSVITVITGWGTFLPALSALLLYVVILKLLFRKKVSTEYRQVNKLIRRLSMVAGLGAGAVGALLVAAGKANDRTAGYMGIPLLMIPISYLVTIGRYRLLGLELRLRRNVQYSLAAIAWGVITLALLLVILLWLPQLHLPLPNVRITGASLEILDAPMEASQQAIVEKGLLMVAAIGLAFIFRTIGRNGQEFLAKKFYRAKYDYRRASSELAEVMSTKLNMIDLARGIVVKLSDLMQLKRAGVLFFRQEKTCCCEEGFGFEENEWKSFCLALPDQAGRHIGRIQGHAKVDYLPSPTKEMFQDAGFLIVVPIRSKERLVGALLLGEKLSESPFQQEDFGFLSGAANQASVAIENAFLYEELAEQDRIKHELEMARRIQLDSLPQRTPTIEGLDLAGRSIPATEVGGDYFDYLDGGIHRLTVVVGDVSGKGTAAALYMSKVQGILRSLHGFGLTPRELFVRANSLLRSDLERKSFVTALGGAFDARKRELIVARAGHLPLFVYRKRLDKVERLLPRGIGFALSDSQLFSSEIEELIVRYEAGDIFVFVSDGITEAQSTGGDLFGEENVSRAIAKLATKQAKGVLEGVLDAVHEFSTGERQNDDQTIVVAKAT